METVSSGDRSIGAFELRILYETGRISKSSYIQLAITLEFGVNGRPVFVDDDHAKEFISTWSIGEKKQIKPSELWSAIANYLKQFDDSSQQSYPLLEYLDEIDDEKKAI